MCTVANAVLVESIVKIFIVADKMFTAFDITTAAKAQGADEGHRDLKGCIHKMFSTGEIQHLGYERTLIDIPSGSPPQAWLYHLPTDDPSGYADKLNDDLAGDGPATDGVATTPVTTPVIAQNETVLRYTDVDGRLCIPTHFLAQLGLTTGDSAEVQPGKEKIEIGPHMPQAVKSFGVNADGRIRISEKMLNLGQLTLSKFKIELDLDNKKIIVTYA